MEVIPAINCANLECVKSKLSVIGYQLSSVSWVHIDIADGKFTPVKTWSNPTELNSQLITYNLQLNIEVHLMADNPEQYIEDWLKAGAKRIIVHLESIDVNIRMNANDTNIANRLAKILEKCSEYDAELMLALNPETPVEEIFPYLDSLLFVQFLAVKPGFSGQRFDKRVFEKIEVMRERAPGIEIEVDGGINPETAKLVKEAGAGIIASASYIFDSENPQKAYRDLVEVVSLF
jgi:ribulose-phosphate 3-epimerase